MWGRIIHISNLPIRWICVPKSNQFGRKMAFFKGALLYDAHRSLSHIPNRLLFKWERRLSLFCNVSHPLPRPPPPHHLTGSCSSEVHRKERHSTGSGSFLSWENSEPSEFQVTLEVIAEKGLRERDGVVGIQEVYPHHMLTTPFSTQLLIRHPTCVNYSLRS